MDLRLVVTNRMTELGVKVPELEERSGVSRQTLYGFLRPPAEGEYGGKVRRGNLGHEALGAILDALQLTVVPTVPAAEVRPVQSSPALSG